MTLTQLFTNIANAIRAKTGSSETIKAENFPTEIADITTGTDTSNVTDFNYAFRDCVFKEIPLLDFSSGGSFTGMFVNCYNLVEIPRFIFATTQRYKMNTMFSSCTSLKNVPLLDIKNVMNISYMFNNCPLLTEKSLNNIMGMCISATKITSNKTLKYIGLSQEQATTCQTLSNYQAFLDAGWTTGY